MVADGMGGAAAGEIASAMAVEVVLGELREKWIGGGTTDAEEFVRAIRRATIAANQQIHNFASSHSEYRGMGTTATVAGLLADVLYVAQVGDSRAYLVRDGIARQITKDQSLMQKLIEAGELTEDEAAQSERRNIILQALGPEPMVKIDLTHQTVRRGDVLVLCSDGLSGQVKKEEIARIVTEETDLVSACKRLIDRANENGGPDNITVIAARFDGSRLEPPVTTDEVGHRVFPLPETGQTPAVPSDAPPSPAARRTPKPGATPSTPPEAVAPVPPVPPSLGTTPPEGIDFSTAPTPPSGSPTVSPKRRQAGTVIAVVLLIALVATAIWFVVRTAQKVAPAADSARGAPAQSGSAPPPKG
jgi:protein phosphatase